jgi:Dolichyl-phosphate-mannose-protein mannosyltransferase
VIAPRGGLARWRLPLLAAVLLLALGLRLYGIAWGLQDANVSSRPHPDEWTVYWLFRWFDTYHSASPCPVSGNQCFFDWGMVFPYLAYGLHLLTLPLFSLFTSSSFGGHADMTFVRTVLAARLLSAIVSTATVYVVYRTALQYFGLTAGLLAAGCAALSCLLIQLGHFGTPDSTTGLLVSLTVLSALHAMDRPSPRSFAFAGALCGVAVGSEYHMALLLVPIAVAWLLSQRKIATYLAVVAISALLGFLLFNIYSVVDFNDWLAAMQHTLRIRTVDSSAQYGTRWSAYGPSWLYVIRYPLGYGVGFPLAVWMVAGALWAAIRREKADIVLLCWLIPYFVLVSISPAKFMRYSAPLLPALAIFAGRLAADMLALRSRPIRFGAVAVASAALLYSLGYDLAYVSLFAKPEPRYVATAWLARQVPVNTPVEYEQLPNGLINLPYFGPPGRFRPCFSQFDPHRLRGPQTFLLTDSYDLEEHPRFSDRQVARFRTALVADRSFTLALSIQYTPSILGLQFPIYASPHDWRYPTHDIAVYKSGSQPRAAHLTPPVCFPTLDAAHKALYPAKRPV